MCGGMRRPPYGNTGGCRYTGKSVKYLYKGVFSLFYMMVFVCVDIRYLYGGTDY